MIDQPEPDERALEAIAQRVDHVEEQRRRARALKGELGAPDLLELMDATTRADD